MKKLFPVLMLCQLFFAIKASAQIVGRKEHGFPRLLVDKNIYLAKWNAFLLQHNIDARFKKLRIKIDREGDATFLLLANGRYYTASIALHYDTVTLLFRLPDEGTTMCITPNSCNVKSKCEAQLNAACTENACDCNKIVTSVNIFAE